MNGIMREEQIERIKKQYPAGTRVCCDNMSDDPNPIEFGILGTVRGVDDAGQIMVAWDNGRGLSLIPGVDSFHITELSQVEAIDKSEVQNMGM